MDEVMRELTLTEQALMREATGLSDWYYYDLPHMTPEFLDKFIAMVGAGNLHWIHHDKRRWPDGSITNRGQVMISPEGIARLVARTHTEKEE